MKYVSVFFCLLFVAGCNKSYSLPEPTGGPGIDPGKYIVTLVATSRECGFIPDEDTDIFVFRNTDYGMAVSVAGLSLKSVDGSYFSACEVFENGVCDIDLTVGMSLINIPNGFTGKVALIADYGVCGSCADYASVVGVKDD